MTQINQSVSRPTGFVRDRRNRMSPSHGGCFANAAAPRATTRFTVLGCTPSYAAMSLISAPVARLFCIINWSPPGRSPVTSDSRGVQVPRSSYGDKLVRRS
jgi:hypothetical protein